MAEYISSDFVETLARYIPPNITKGDAVTANPAFDEACKLLWFAATGQAFPIEDDLRA